MTGALTAGDDLAGLTCNPRRSEVVTATLGVAPAPRKNFGCLDPRADHNQSRVMRWVLRIAPIVVLFSLNLNERCLAQEKTAPSVQQQLDELKQGQERILRELQAIRAALQGTATRSEAAARPPLPAVLNVHGEPFKGQSNAPVAIVEYSDFDCSHCAKFATEIFPQIDQKYVATGKVKFFFRDLPEPGNPESLLKARLARCAGEQGKFWEMHDYLFTQKPTLVGSDLSRESEIFGLDRAVLGTCLKNEKYSVMIQRSAAGATRMGIQGTPAFIIGRLTDNGDIVHVSDLLLGVEKLDAFESVLEPLLSDSGK